MKFKDGDEVTVSRCTTPGSEEFREWCADCIRTQKVLTIIDCSIWGGEYVAFLGTQWVLKPVDIVPFLSIQENE
jgi:hypothetical protein